MSSDCMPDGEAEARQELSNWQREMLREPDLIERTKRRLQAKVNSYIPDRAHEMVTKIIKQMTQAVLVGSHYTTQSPLTSGTLLERETLVRNKIDIYRRTAVAEGGITGAGGFLLGLADMPLLITIKLKLLFEIATLYGIATDDYKERIYLLHIFQLAFSSGSHRRDVYFRMIDWLEKRERLPASLDEFDWRTFQQEYRDYVDLAKLAQLLPIIGAPVGMIVNNRLILELGRTAMNAYRMRWFETTHAKLLPTTSQQSSHIALRSEDSSQK